MRVRFQLEGAEEFRQRLLELGTRVEKNVSRPAVRASQKVLLAAARQSALRLATGSGRLFAQGDDDVSMSRLIADNLVIAAPRRQVKHSYSLHVQLRRGVDEFYYYAKGSHTNIDLQHRDKGGRIGTKIGSTKGVSYIPMAIEYGHMAGGTYVPPKPFLRPPAQGTETERMRVLEKELDSGIMREAIIRRST